MAIFYGSLNYTTSGRKRKVTRAKKSKKTPFTPATTTNVPSYAETRLAESAKYKSAPLTGGADSCSKKESPKYTGTLVKGIGTMHKSNAIPIIDEEQMKDIARMRR